MTFRKTTQLSAFTLLVAVGLIGVAPVYATFPTYGPRQQVLLLNWEGNPAVSATADFNCDGVVDVVFVRKQSPNTLPVAIILADGRGAFTDGTSQVISGVVPQVQYPRVIVIDDFNGDGRTDIFIADTGDDRPPFPGYQNTLLLSTSDCHLVDGTSGVPQQSDFTHSATAADIDNDGDVDLYVGNVSGGQQVPPQIWLNDGTGRFTVALSALPPAQINLSQNKYPASLLVDVDGDGDADLVLGGARDTPNSVVLLNDGAGHFSLIPGAMPAKPFAANAIVLDIKSADVNEDGHPDLVLSVTKGDPSYQGRWLQVLINNGNGSRFRDETAERFPQVDNNLNWIVSGRFVDLDGDGHVDFGGELQDNTGDNHRFYVANPHGAFAEVALVQGQLANVFSLVDINGDGHRDFLTFAKTGPTTMVFRTIANIGPVLPPGIPQGVAATHKLTDHVRVRWPYVWGARSYEVWRSSDPSSIGTQVATVSQVSFDDAPVSSAEQYYRVRAVNSAGVSAHSSPASGAIRP